MERQFGEFRTSTSAVRPNFTEDMILEILLRLPAKSLMRFKCVSKRWQSLISGRDFVKSHLQRLKAGDIISSQRIFKTGPLETINYEALDGSMGGDGDREVVKYHQPRMGVDVSRCDPKLVGSCDGLVCLCVRGRFVLYNPTTKESRNLPRTPKKAKGSDLFQLHDLIQGLGYDSRSDGYKIVQCKVPGNWPKDSGEWEVEIFSLKSGSWRRTQPRLGSHLSVETGKGRGVYWNGALHWCVVDYSTETADIVIISFDLSEEKFQHVLSVPKVNEHIRPWELGIHGANLLMFYGDSNDCLEAWTTSEYGKGGSWTKLFSVSTEGIPASINWDEIPIVCTRSGKIVFELSGHEIILFNPEDNTYKDYPIQKSGEIDSIIYVETLVSPQN
ncbi:F-box domain-containing protein [Psidium guajava]|nr:F-box domain-containing protein [Psidium guajava]